MKEIDSIKLKATLLVEGINYEQEAMQGVGSKYKEQNHGLFGWDFENHPDVSLPDDFCLPDGTIVQFRFNSGSPYCVKKIDDQLFLFQGEEAICEIKWIERPGFYTAFTSSGNEMVKIGQIGGADCLFFCYNNYCSYFSHKKECLFCNLVSTSKTYNSVLRKKDFNDIGEVTAAAWAEGTVNHILLTGGCFRGEKEVQIVSHIMASIKEHTGFDRIPGTVLPSPAKGNEILRYYETGIQAIGFSMEIWDERLYSAICPGKAETTSHDDFMNSIKAAVKTFGAGNVYGVFVMGLEPRDSFLEGIKVLHEEGANVVPFVWSPNPGSRLEGHRAPSPDWYTDVIREAAEIAFASGVPSGTENHCYRCDGNNLLHDALREKGVV